MRSVSTSFLSFEELITWFSATRKKHTSAFVLSLLDYYDVVPVDLFNPLLNLRQRAQNDVDWIGFRRRKVDQVHPSSAIFTCCHTLQPLSTRHYSRLLIAQHPSRFLLIVLTSSLCHIVDERNLADVLFPSQALLPDILYSFLKSLIIMY